MKKLEDITKKHPFTAPEGYFDKLPGVIQARVEKESKASTKSYLVFGLQYALPAIVLIVAAIFYFKPSTSETPETIIASVSATELKTYLELTEFSSDYYLDESSVDEESIEEIESTLFNDIDLTDAVIDTQYELTIDFENF